MKTSPALTFIFLSLFISSNAIAYELIGDGFDAPDSGDDTHSSTAIDISNDGKFISIGSPHAGTDDQGQVKVYKSVENEDGSVRWTQFGNTVKRNQIGAHVGISVGISYDATRLVVGHLIDGGPKGSISIYRYLERKNEWKWMKTFKGGSKVVDISASGKKVVASSDNYVQVYSCYSNSCVTNGKQIDLPENYFLKDVAIASGGQSLVIGAVGEGTNIESLSGIIMVYTFDVTTTDWVLKKTFNGSNANERAGFSVSISQAQEMITVAYSVPKASCDSVEFCGGVKMFLSTDGGETFSESANNIQGTLTGEYLGLTIDLSVNGQVITVSSLGPESKVIFKIYTRDENTNVWTLVQEIKSAVEAQSVGTFDSRLSFDGQRIVNVSPGSTNMMNTIEVFDRGAPSVSQFPTERPSLSIAPSVSQFPTEGPSTSSAPSVLQFPTTRPSISAALNVSQSGSKSKAGKGSKSKAGKGSKSKSGKGSKSKSGKGGKAI